MPPIYYPAVIDRSASGFGVSFPDFPGCVAAGATVQEAAVNAEAALGLHLEGMGAGGDTIPPPSRLEDIEHVEGAEDVARILVRAELPGKVTRVLLSLDESLVGAIDAIAPNRSAFLADAARAALRGRTGSGSDFLAVAWPKKGGYQYREQFPEMIFAHRSVRGVYDIPGDYAIVRMKEPVTPAMIADVENYLKMRDFPASVGRVHPQHLLWAEIKAREWTSQLQA